VAHSGHGGKPRRRPTARAYPDRATRDGSARPSVRSPIRLLRRRLRGNERRPQVNLRRRLTTPAPEIPDGWTLGPPDFVGVGVQKGGTTWWWTLLAAHPDMVSRIKETHHLIRMGWRPMGEEEVASYHRLFPRPEGGVTGEWTPRYMAAPGVSDNLVACAPDAKLLALLRDPYERYRSGVGQWRKRKERLGLRLDMARGQKDAVARSFYGFQLRRYVEAYGSDRLLVLQLERCKADPAGEFRRTLEFLGMSPWEPPVELLGNPVNVTRRGKADPSDEERRRLLAAFEEDVRLLRRLVPDLDLGLWPNFEHLVGE
jgi:hypothetical protein